MRLPGSHGHSAGSRRVGGRNGRMGQMPVGREAECDRIATLLADAGDQRSGALVLCGEAGIGKSALCAWAVARADRMRVVSVRGVESEADLPFADALVDHVQRYYGTDFTKLGIMRQAGTSIQPDRLSAPPRRRPP